MKKILQSSLLLFAIFIVQVSTNAQSVKVVANSDLAKTTINKHIYGHFAEHLGKCIYGGLYVGEDNTTIPHTDGVRNDIIEALKDLKVPNLRWPGGCFADAYQWKDGIGPKKDRPSMINAWWGGITEDNSFGTHDFLNLCERIDAEPYLAANVGSGTVQDLIDWVTYVNHKAGSPMSEERIKNGRAEPWNVSMWGVGNEAWGCGGNMTAEHYANIYRQYATFMADWTNTSGLYRIASGASDDNYNWTETLMKNIPHNMMSALALHHYSVIDWNVKGPSIGFTEAHYARTMEEAWKMEELVTNHSTVMDKYDPDKKVDLIVDEWGGWYTVEEGTNPSFLYQQNTMRDAMIAGISLNIFNNHADRVRGANLAQIINVLQAVILTEGEKMILTPTYHVMKMYNVHQDAKLIPISFESPKYNFENKSLPALSVSASKDDQGSMNVSITNIDYSASHEIDLDIRGDDFSNVTAQILTSSDITDYNDFDNPNLVAPKTFTNFSFADGKLKFEVPAYSVVVFNLK